METKINVLLSDASLDANDIFVRINSLADLAVKSQDDEDFARYIQKIDYYWKLARQLGFYYKVYDLVQSKSMKEMDEAIVALDLKL